MEFVFTYGSRGIRPSCLEDMTASGSNIAGAKSWEITSLATNVKQGDQTRSEVKLWRLKVHLQGILPPSSLHHCSKPCCPPGTMYSNSWAYGHSLIQTTTSFVFSGCPVLHVTMWILGWPFRKREIFFLFFAFIFVYYRNIHLVGIPMILMNAY